jgi:hypothetical protein
MGARVGLDAKLYRNSGAFATPTWNELTNAKDVTLNLESGEADASRRGTGGWRETLMTLKDGSIEFELVYDNTDAEFVALKDAFLASTPVDMLALDGDVTVSGNQGLRIIAQVTSFSRNEPLEEALTVSVTIKPTPNPDSPPTWFVVP